MQTGSIQIGLLTKSAFVRMIYSEKANEFSPCASSSKPFKDHQLKSLHSADTLINLCCSKASSQATVVSKMKHVERPSFLEVHCVCSADLCASLQPEQQTSLMADMIIHIQHRERLNTEAVCLSETMHVN